jgi:hypothetical protein
VARQVVPAHAEVPPVVLSPPAKEGKRVAKVLTKTGAWQASRSASVRGCGQGFVKVMGNQVLVDVEMGASDDLPLIIRQSLKDGRYSPSTGIEEIDWQIMLEQFIVNGVVVNDEIINIDSD